ncbi:hypothetical protein V5F32_07550 [Xanthobacter oligotrophicus]|uniref:Uncharacterized protein n=1 Tax=Xanthobacter oligotrophicus TaxID=2607286 RepID=A0ABW6ZTF0_9HYPH
MLRTAVAQRPVQFEDLGSFEPWLIGHACALVAKGIDPRRLRAKAATQAHPLRDAGRAILAEWLGGLRS